jgi:hypothetical protein
MMIQRNRSTLVILSLLAISVVVASDCKGPAPRSPRSPFVRGIRIHQDEAVTMALAPIPLPGCPGGGQWLGQVGQQSPQSGNVGVFLGGTDQYGDLDQPDARDNAIWEVFSGPAKSPPCPQASATATVPPGGGIFNFICHLVG